MSFLLRCDKNCIREHQLVCKKDCEKPIYPELYIVELDNYDIPLNDDGIRFYMI